MTDQEFEALVGRLEQKAKQNPRAYRARVLATALLGNAYLAAVLVVIVALLALALVSVAWLKAAGAKIALVVGMFLWLVLKALWIRLDPPEGIEVNSAEAPELFAMIEELRRKLRAPRFHHILVTDDFNAGVIQNPRLGIFGWHQNYLMIGLPLTKALTVEQFKAVLAHEFGHLAKGHGALGNWIYRQRLRWSRLMSTLEAVESKGLWLFRPFLRWYAPYFNAVSYPMARSNEFEADAVSARLVSPPATAQALTAVSVVGSYLQEEYWPQIHRKADEVSRPTGFAPYAGMGKLSSDLEPQAIHDWLQAALARETTLDDTHPCLRERLGALNEKPELALPQADAAADRLLGRAVERITRLFDERWKEGIAPSWEQRHRTVQEGRKRLAELDAKANSGAALTVQEAFDRAICTESWGGDGQAAVEQLRALNARVPEDPVVRYSLGARLLRQDDESGMAMLEAAMRFDAGETMRCCEALRDYCWRKGRKDEAHRWHARLAERALLEQGAAKERDAVRLGDKFLPHGLAGSALAKMRGELRGIPGLAKAWLAEKRVRYMPERRCWVLGFTVRGWRNKKQRVAEVLARIQHEVSFPGEALIISVEGGNYRFRRKLRWRRGTRIL